MRHLAGLTFGLVALGVATTVDATTWYVDDDASGGNGMSWATAFNDLQLALDVVQPGDDVWVAEGTYVPSDLSSADPRSARFHFVVADVRFYGGFVNGETVFENRDWVNHPTILSGDLGGNDGVGVKLDNAYRVVRFTDSIDGPIGSTNELDGFIVTGGYGYDGDPLEHGRNGCGITCGADTAPTIRNCSIIDNHTGVGFAFGGGASILPDAAPAFVDCEISGNTAERGGGVYADRADPTFTRCRFEGNIAESSGGALRLAMDGASGTTSATMTDCDLVGNTAGGGAGVATVSESQLTMTGCLVEGGTAGTGGGIQMFGSGTITDCTIQDNVADGGGGMLFSGAGADALVADCFIMNNVAIGVGATRNGGGARLDPNSHPHFRDVQFIGNRSAEDGGGLDIWYDAYPRITRGLFQDNRASDGGAIANEGQLRISGTAFEANQGSRGAAIRNDAALGDTPLRIKNAVFLGNRGEQPEPPLPPVVRSDGAAIYNTGPLVVASTRFLGNYGIDGGAVYNVDGGGTSILMNCLFSGNSAVGDDLLSGHGGALINSSGGLLTVVNSTFATNDAERDGGGICVQGGHVDVQNSILWANVDGSGGAGQVLVQGGTVAVDYSCIEGGWPAGTNNISSDPNLRDRLGPDTLPGTADDDLRVDLGSPVTDAGDNDFVPMDDTDLDGDGDTGETTPRDLGGAPRFRDDINVPDTGNGFPPVVDIGAFEIADCQDDGIADDIQIQNGWVDDENGNGVPDECDNCVGDTNDDFVVDVTDLVAVILDWGCTGPLCVGDVTGDGTVDVSDLVAVIIAWGDCP